MVHTFSISGAEVVFSLATRPTVFNGILPGIDFSFRFQNKDSKVTLNNFKFKFSLINSQGGKIFVKFLDFDTPQIEINKNDAYHLSGYLLLDPYLLHKIEEIREGGDLNYFIFGHVLGERLDPKNIPHKGMGTNLQVTESISKSDWVEKFLPRFNFKHVQLVEIPHLTSQSFEKIAGYLSDAWKQKHMGHYDNTLTDCRRAIEETRKMVKSLGYVNENTERRDKTDWAKYFDNKDIGDIFTKIDQHLYRFTSKGAHPNKGINREDADYALLISQAGINYVIKTFENSTQSP